MRDVRPESPSDLLLLLLYAGDPPNQPIEGATRMQKLIFLLQKESDLGRVVSEAKEFSYAPYKMGPFSADLRAVIDDLVAAGVVRVERLRYALLDDGDRENDDSEAPTDSRRYTRAESVRYSLGPVGALAGKDLWETLSSEERKRLVRFKAFFGSLSLRQLLIYTYQRYPDQTTKSEIRAELGLEEEVR